MWLIEGLRGRPLRADHQDPPRADRRHRRRRPGDGAVRPLPGPTAAADTPGARGSRTREPGAAELVAAGLRGAVRAGIALAEGALDALSHPERALAARARGGRGHRRDRLGRPEPRAGDAAERRHRPAPALRRRRQPARRLQARQERLRRNRQRRRARGRRRRAALVPDLPRGAHRGHGDARARARLGPRRGRARRGRQPHRRDARAAAGLHRRPGPAPALRLATRWTA